MFSNHYQVHEVLGKGAFGTVRRCVKKSTGQVFAVKEIIIKKASKRDLEDTREEINICRKLRHPNIARLYESFEGNDFWYLVFDLVVGGELMVDIEDREYYSEADASYCMKQILEAINYCHKKGIVHRDLKPENILLASKTKGAAIKVADFGLAIEVVGNQYGRHGSAGTLPYMAPEAVADDYYGKSVDVWSCGVILYLLLIGDLPFDHRNEDVLMSKIMNGTYDYPSDRRNTVSQNAKDIIEQMLTMESLDRITAAAALSHPWIYQRDVVAPKCHLAKTVVNLKKFNARRKFKAAIIATLAAKKLSNIFNKDGLGKGKRPSEKKMGNGSSENMKHKSDLKKNPDDERQKIFELTQYLISACNAGDSRTVEKLCDPYITTFDSNRGGDIVEGKDFFKLIFGRTYEPDKIANPYVHLLGDEAAYIAYIRLTKNAYNDDYDEREETIVWHNQDGEWKAVHYHSGLFFESQ